MDGSRITGNSKARILITALQQRLPRTGGSRKDLIDFVSQWGMRGALLVILLLWAASPAMANNFTVMSSGDTLHAGPNYCSGNAGSCTFRDAITEGNSLAGPHTITFGVLQVTLTTHLPHMQAPFIITGNLPIRTIINGSPDNINHYYCLQLSDASSAQNPDGANGSIIQNLVIQNCNGDGISANGHGYTFLNNYIGTDVTGLTAVPNSGHGISVSASQVYPDTSSNFLLNLYNSFPVQPIDSSKITDFSSHFVTALQSLTLPVKITGNVISGNAQNGIEIFSQNLAGVIVSGNMIGTDLTGNAKIPNGQYGIHFVGSTFGNLIGPDNVISGNAHDGIRVEAGAVFLPNFIMGNRIGLSATDSNAHVGNGDSGIYVDTKPSGDISQMNPSGLSLMIGPGNVISDNQGMVGNGGDPTAWPDDVTMDSYAGVFITGSSSSVKVVGNTIGMAEFPAGTPVSSTSFGNSGDGILITSSGNTVGGSSSSDANIIAANTRHGIVIRGSATSGNDIIGNYIGLHPSFSGTATGNAFDGIQINAASGTTIGGSGATDYNTITKNGRNGIALRNGSSSNGWSNMSQRNLIFGNAKAATGIGIDLEYSKNGPDDPSNSEYYSNYANLDQHQPIICTGDTNVDPPACGNSSAPSYAAGNTTLDWTLFTHGPATFRIEFYAIDSTDDNTATGMTFLGEETVTTTVNVPSDFPATLASSSAGTSCSGTVPGRCTSTIAGNAGGKNILITATDVTQILMQPGATDWMSYLKCFAGNNGIIVAPCNVNNTSEFSNVVAVPANNTPPVAVDDSGAGYSVLKGATLDMPAPGVLANDTDVDGNTLTVTTWGTAAYGTVNGNSDGSFSYVSTDPNYTGSDSFTYTISDGQGGTASATVTISVAANPTSTGIVSSANPVAYGQNITFTATITGNSPTGTVDFQEGGVNIAACTAVAVSASQAQCSTASLDAGTHTITALYSGDANNAASASTGLSQIVNKSDTTTAITGHTPDPSSVGGAILVTATVSVTAPGGGTPGGNINVTDGVVNCTITLPGTSCNLTPASPGSKTLTATYAGDSNFNGSASGGTSQTVNPAGAVITTTAITVVNPQPSGNTTPFATAVYGQTVDATATVTAGSGAAAPDGDVTITAGSSSCTAALGAPVGLTSTGTCTLSPQPTASASAYSVSASYAGTATFSASTSNGAGNGGLTVNKASTSTSITSDLSTPSDVGVAIAVNAAVLVTGPGGGTPTGTITVNDGTGDHCTITLPATGCNLTPASAGAKTMSATYGGSGNFLGSSSPGVAHTVNTPPVATHFSVSAPASVPAGTAFSFTVTALDASNATVTGYAGTVHFTSSELSATLPANSILTNGVGTFSATLTAAGNQTLTATDTLTSISGTSNAVSVSAGAATHFSVSAPATATAGTGFIFTIAALDGFNNIDTGYAGSVHFTSTDGAASLPIDSTLTNGLGSFSATLKTAGSRTVTSTDTAINSISGTSSAILVSAGTATHLSLSAPASATAGNSFSFTVTALDAFSNIDTGYAGSVHFTSTDGAASLPIDSTLTNGLGSFSATLKTAGSRTVTSTDTAINSISGTSSAILVSGAAATHLSVSGPAGALKNAAINVTVTALDQFNNTASGYTGTVHFTSTDGSALLPANYTFLVADNDVHTFSVTLSTLGTQTVTAIDTIAPAINGISNSINVVTTTSTTTLTAGPNPSVFGQSITLTGTVSGTSGTPTGTITFKDGANTLCNTVSMNGSAQAQCITSALNVSSHGLTGVYSGDSTYAGSTSAAVTQVVHKAGTTTAITAHTPNPSNAGSAIAVSANATASAPGTGTPTGSITVTDGTVNCIITLPATSCNLTPATSGSKTLAATYSGDSNFNGSTSPGVSHTVNTAVNPPAITKSFWAPTMALHGTTSLSFTITNPNGSTVLTGVGFSDTLPSGLVVASPNGLSGSCGGGTITAPAGSSAISLSGASLSGGSHCTFSVNVMSTSTGVKNNTTGAVTSIEGGAGGTASASISVILQQSITLAAATGNGNITLSTNTPGCGFSNVQTKTEAQVGSDPSMTYPYGLVVFTINCSTADVTITFPGSVSGTSYRKYGPSTPGNPATTQWYAFPALVSGNTVTLHLNDGQLGDDTAVDGFIVDAGGPAILDPASVSAVNVPTMTEWGMILFMLMAGIGAAWYLMRSRSSNRG